MKTLFTCIVFACVVPACVQEEPEEKTLDEQIQEGFDDAFDDLYGTDLEAHEEYLDERNEEEAQKICDALEDCESETFEILNTAPEIGSCKIAVLANLNDDGDNSSPLSGVGACLEMAYYDGFAVGFGKPSELEEQCNLMIHTLYFAEGFGPYGEGDDAGEGGCLLPALWAFDA